MPSIREYKLGLKGATLGFAAGAHAVTESVWQSKSDRLTGDKRATSYKALQKLVKSVLKNADSIHALSDYLNEEDLYPFSTEWSLDAISGLVTLLKAPKLNLDDPFEANREFKFKKGFHKVLTVEARKRYAVADEDADIQQSQLDHWLALIIGGSFHAGAVAASRLSTDTAAFRSALHGVEEESEPWSRYEQLARMYESEVSREDGDDDEPRRGRDDSGFDDGDDDDSEDDEMERHGFGYDDDQDN
jgi:hypothetical protein